MNNWGRCLVVVLGGALSCRTPAFADVGQTRSVASASVEKRRAWSGLHAQAGHRDSDTGGPVETFWTRDAEPDERKFFIVYDGDRSVEESFIHTSADANYDLAATAKNDLGDAISIASLVDYRTATRVAIVDSTALLVRQVFYAGKTWGYQYTASTRKSESARTFIWTQFPRTDLARRVILARACAKSGECGE